MEKDDNTLAYIELVEYVADDMDKTERWVKRILARQPDSLAKFLDWFSHNKRHTNTEEIREKRYELLKTCPVDMLPIVLNSTRNVSQPKQWEALIYSKFERRMRACARGEEVDPDGLEFLDIARLAIVKMTCQNVLPV